MFNAVIKGTGSYVPKKVLTNYDLEKMVETSDEWIVTRTGIKERRIAEKKEATSDLALRAATAALKNAKVEPEEIDLVIVGTVTPDYPFPSVACILQRKLGLKNAFGFDVSAGCTGFVYSLAIANSFIKAGIYSNALVIGAETLSKVTDWTDRNTCILFGDGAGAVVLKQAKGTKRGILSTHLFSDGTMWDNLYIPAGGSMTPPSADTLDKKLHYIRMAGNETFKLAVKFLGDSCLKALEYNKVNQADVKYFIPHQANLRIIQATAKRLSLPIEKVYINIDRYGNTSSASIPVALDEANNKGLLNEGDLILFTAFGAGYTWGSALVRW